MAARWVHLLAGLVTRLPEHGALRGLLLAADCGRGPQARFLRASLPHLVTNTVASWVWAWMTALFVQYVCDRASLRALLVTASSVVLRINLA